MALRATKQAGDELWKRTDKIVISFKAAQENSRQTE